MVKFAVLAMSSISILLVHSLMYYPGSLTASPSATGDLYDWAGQLWEVQGNLGYVTRFEGEGKRFLGTKRLQPFQFFHPDLPTAFFLELEKWSVCESQGLRRKRLTLPLPEKKWEQDSSKKVDIHWLWSDTRRLLISSAILKALRSAKWIFLGGFAMEKAHILHQKFRNFLWADSWHSL